MDLAGATVRSVTQGIGRRTDPIDPVRIGCLVAGVPGAGLWALLILLLAVVQLPSLLVLGPIIIYVFSTANTVTAVLFTIWSLRRPERQLPETDLAGAGRRSMVVIFIGAIGGFITSGIIGLFIGATILTLGYRLFLAWLQGRELALRKGDSQVLC